MSGQRLDKIISTQLNISRKDTRLAIRKGLAVVNEAPVLDPAFSVNPDNDRIIFDGQALNYKKYIYLIMNKPKGVLSASQDKKRETVVDLVPDNIKRNGLFPVGRLDRDTTGLIMITDDGDFAHNAISPKKNIFKTYIATLDGPVTEEMIPMFKNGIVLADGTVCRTAYLKALPDNCAEIKICEGRYHQIKRMFGVVGLGVNELHRKAIGKLVLCDNFSVGFCREMTLDEKKFVFEQEK